VLVQYDTGTIEVRGVSNRPGEAARLGYLPRHHAPAPARRQTPRPPPRPVPVCAAADPGPPPTTPRVVADRLLESLLDDQQRRDRRAFGRWWVEVDRGWLQMGGNPHDLRLRLRSAPNTPWSLCVVVTDPTLPPGDVWSTLLLTATANSDVFFKVANWSPAFGRTPPPVFDRRLHSRPR
jgi:hypothetical protein